MGLYKDIRNLPEGYWRNQKLQEVQQLVERCSGLWIDVTSTTEFVVQGDTMRVQAAINNRLGANAQLVRFTLDAFDSTFNKPLAVNTNTVITRPIYVFTTKPVTQPYWLEHKNE